MDRDDKILLIIGVVLALALGVALGKVLGLAYKEWISCVTWFNI